MKKILALAVLLLISSWPAHAMTTDETLCFMDIASLAGDTSARADLAEILYENQLMSYQDYKDALTMANRAASLYNDCLKKYFNETIYITKKLPEYSI